LEDAAEDLVNFLERQVLEGAPFREITEIAPDLSLDDAYRLQFELMSRRVKRGDPLIGYKAAYTNYAIQKLRGRNVMLGSLLQSMCLDSGATMNVGSEKVLVEPEIAVLLKSDLCGPGLTHQTVLPAIEGYMAAIELEKPVVDRPKQTEHMMIATHKLDHRIILGGPVIAPHGIDLRLEGSVTSISGAIKGSGTGAEVLGNPLKVVAIMANKLATFGMTLKAGMVLMTGTLVSTGMTAEAGDDVTVEFTRLGRVSVHLRK
jgi:2-keto-4-pentenoate hydratase